MHFDTCMARRIPKYRDVMGGWGRSSATHDGGKVLAACMHLCWPDILVWRLILTPVRQRLCTDSTGAAP